MTVPKIDMQTDMEGKPIQQPETVVPVIEEWTLARSLEDEDMHIGDTFGSRDEAIRAAADYLGYPIGDFFQTGLVRPTTESPPSPLDAEHAIDNIEHDDWGETVMEKWTDKAMPHVADLQERIDKAYDEWIVAHDLKVDLLYVDHVETHTIEACDEDVPGTDPPAPCVRPEFHDGEHHATETDPDITAAHPKE